MVQLVFKSQSFLMETGSILTHNNLNKILLIVSELHGKMVSTFSILLKFMVKEKLKDKLVRLWDYLMFQDTSMSSQLKYSGAAQNKFQQEEDYQENTLLKELKHAWKDLIKNTLMFVSVTDQILRLQWSKHAGHLTGWSVMDISFIGVLVNGALNKFHKLITFVKSTHLTSQLCNNLNTTFIVERDLK